MFEQNEIKKPLLDYKLSSIVSITKSHWFRNSFIRWSIYIFMQ